MTSAVGPGPTTALEAFRQVRDEYILLSRVQPMNDLKSLMTLASISTFQAVSATSTGRNSIETSKVSIAAVAMCSIHLPMPTRTVKSSGLPWIAIVSARSASINPARNPPFLAWMTVPCALGAEV
jgi:hypothetical protein